MKAYENLIETGKRRIGYYRSDVSDGDRFLMSFLIYFSVLLMVVFTADYLAQKVYEDSDSLTPLQELEVEIIYRVQKDVLGMPVTVNRTSNTIWYDTNAEWRGQTFAQEEKIGGFGLEVASVCTGFHEMVFLGVLVLGFRGVPFRLRVKWAIILLAIVFVENLFRIGALYPLAIYQGREFQEWFHFYWWHYGQYIFIMGLFGLWFLFVARKNVIGQEDHVKADRIRQDRWRRAQASSRPGRSRGKRERTFRLLRQGLPAPEKPGSGVAAEDSGEPGEPGHGSGKVQDVGTDGKGSEYGPAGLPRNAEGKWQERTGDRDHEVHPQETGEPPWNAGIGEGTGGNPRADGSGTQGYVRGGEGRTGAPGKPSGEPAGTERGTVHPDHGTGGYPDHGTRASSTEGTHDPVREMEEWWDSWQGKLDDIS